MEFKTVYLDYNFLTLPVSFIEKVEAYKASVISNCNGSLREVYEKKSFDRWLEDYIAHLEEGSHLE